jgi:hypothetical protein
MGLLLLTDTFVAVFFALSIVFFAKTLPWPWVAALSIPVIAAYLVYKKLGRVEASMNESVREYEVFFSDRKKLIYATWLALIIIGAFLIFGLAEDVKLLPLDETSTAIRRVNVMAGELENVRKALDKWNATEEKQFSESLRIQREIADGVKPLAGEMGKLEQTVGNASEKGNADAKRAAESLERAEKILTDLKEILARQGRGEK